MGFRVKLRRMKDHLRQLVVRIICPFESNLMYWRLFLVRSYLLYLVVRLKSKTKVSTMIKPVALTMVTLAFVSGLNSEQKPEVIETEISLPLVGELNITWQEEREKFAKELRLAFVLPLVDARSYADWIIEASDRQGLDRYVLASLVAAESDFVVDATSRVGAFGPAQIRRELWEDFCYATDLNSPGDNISCAAQILTYFRERCGSLECALKSYNVGFKNHSNANAYYVAAGNRYVGKVEQNLTKLDQSIKF